MKTLLIGFVIAITFNMCDSDTIAPKKLVGKWAPAYQIQNKNADGTWGPWTTINTFVALPTIEFTSKGDFLTEGNPGAGCCYAGNKFTVSDNVITFTENKSCPEVRCAKYTEWIIQRLDSDTLVTEVFNSRSKYSRAK